MKLLLYLVTILLLLILESLFLLILLAPIFTFIWLDSNALAHTLLPLLDWLATFSVSMLQPITVDLWYVSVGLT